MLADEVKFVCIIMRLIFTWANKVKSLCWPMRLNFYVGRWG